MQIVIFVRTLDKKLSGAIEFDELTKGLGELGFNLTLQEQYTLMRQFDTGEWKLNMKTFYEALGGKKA
jgi:Ca2+-binding EF-hand superfamily protein